ncbi:hypothetical protein BJ684DRAFT_4877, partial [Piptocephalis cylindrospora]
MSDTITVQIKSASEAKLSVEIPSTATIRELKEAIEAKATDAPADRQRLIYSGKVLKDTETVASYKIFTGHTVHMVKGPAKATTTSSSTTSSSTSANTQSATNPSSSSAPADPFAAMAGLAGSDPSSNPMASLGGGPGGGMDPSAILQLMQNPAVAQATSAMMQDPAFVEAMLANHPMGSDPHTREMLQSPMFQQMLSNPALLQAMMSMRAPPSATDPSSTAPTSQAAPDSAQMASLLAAMAGGGAGGAGGFPTSSPPTSSNSSGSPPAPSIPPEDRYQEQLRQLNEMGFWEPQRNIQALQLTGGNVSAAIEWLL